MHSEPASMMCVHVQECMNCAMSELYGLQRSEEQRTVMGMFKLQLSLEGFAPLLDCRHFICLGPPGGQLLAVLWCICHIRHSVAG